VTVERKCQITCAAELSSLAEFRDFIEANCFDHPGMNDRVLYDLKLAADEACTNIIQHGYAGMNPGSIIVELEIKPEQVEMTITDFGRAFEPSRAPSPDLEAALEDQAAGGFGLFFIYNTMDEVDYESDEAGNSLKLTKKFSTKKA
jgi:anti-sigma regulatory factor (Ser/Thr protein kinase)